MNGKVLPHNLEAEQSVLGASFISKNALQSADTPIVEDGKEMNLYDVTPSPKKQDIDELLDFTKSL